MCAAIAEEVVVEHAIGHGLAPHIHGGDLLGIETSDQTPGGPQEGVAAIEGPDELEIAANPLHHHGVAVVVEPAVARALGFSLLHRADRSIERIVVAVDVVSKVGAGSLIEIRNGVKVAVVLALEHLRHIAADEGLGPEGGAEGITLDPGVGEGDIKQAAELAVGEAGGDVPGPA